MKPAAIVSSAYARGVLLFVEGDRLRYRCAPGALAPDLRAEIAGARDSIVAYLSSPARKTPRDRVRSLHIYDDAFAKATPKPGLGWGELPEGWRLGPVDACVECGRGCASHDDKGRPRHPRCRPLDTEERS